MLLPLDCIVEPFVCLRGGITIKVQVRDACTTANPLPGSLNALLPPPPPQTIAGSQFDVEVDRSWTVQQLKQKLEERLNVSPEQIKYGNLLTPPAGW